MQKYRSLVLTVVITFIFVIHGCNINEYTTSPENIIKSFPELLVSSDAVVGIYGHSDIGAIIFSYNSTSENVVDKILIQTQSKGWTVKWRKDAEVELFQEIKPQKTINVKKTRIYHNKETGHVCVAWIWIDSRSELEVYEGQWAAEDYWPKYEQCKKSLKNT